MSDTIQNRPADKYSPLYFLASVGAGGLAVTFFMYLMFWVPHPNAPVPVFEDIVKAWNGGSIAKQFGIAVALTGIAGFAFLNLKMLFWNLSQYAKFKKTDAYVALRKSNAETQILAYPLALAMSVNALFILGLVFVPGLWGIVEYLFPMALVAFAAIATLAFIEIGHFLRRILTEGGIFDVTANNSFAQLLPGFALIMSAVGMAAPAAMSTVKLTVGTSLVMSTVVGTVATLYVVIAAVTAFNSMLHHGTAKESGPTLMVVVPFLTIFGIMTMRQSHGLHVMFEDHTAAVSSLMFMTKILAIQFAFAALGLLVMRRQKYADAFLKGDGNSPGSYALVCPGVALSVMMHFWINKGLVANGLIAKFGVAYWGFTAVAIGFQFGMIALVLYLNRRHFRRAAPMAAVPAE